ncbi:MAG TPA: hypothetical protein ENK09_08465 [Nitrospirae bacterium]|nr:hypothetical protein [Nitrospirota bacterium]
METAGYQYDVSTYLDRLYEIYREIDNEYNRAASYYDFSCNGCETNCCDTVFYHHTLIEYFAVLEGFDNLPEQSRMAAMERAKAYVKTLNRYRGKESLVRIMCPLNFNGLCGIYEHRPLICRIHGLPGLLKHPGKGTRSFSGCKRFETINRKERNMLIDRTPFYTQIATLEGQLRRAMEYLMKFNKTIAEMLIDRNLTGF